MMIQGAIFDLDGTLLDSMPAWNTLGSDFLRSIGIVPQGGLNETLRSLSLLQGARYLRAIYGVPLSEEEIIASVTGRIRRAYEQELLPKRGVEELLKCLAGHGVRMCVATATQRPLAEAALKRCGLARFFSTVLTCPELGTSKDEPHIYRAALAHLGTDRQTTLVFEDALHALKTAAEDGFPTVAVYDASEPMQADMRRIARAVLDDYASAEAFWQHVSGGCGA